MAVRKMVSKERWLESPETVEVVTDYPGHEAGSVRHDKACPNDNPNKLDRAGVLSEGCYAEYGEGHGRCWVVEPLYMETTHVGVVLALGEMNGYDDSDFYAVVWTGTGTERVEYASTRGWTYPNGAAVDATPEVLAAYEAHCEAARAARRAAEEAAEAATPRKGRVVKVVRGRKVPKGTVGTVIWYGAGKDFGPKPRYRGGWTTTPPMRVGVKDASGTVHWTAASNVEVVESADKEAA